MMCTKLNVLDPKPLNKWQSEDMNSHVHHGSSDIPMAYTHGHGMGMHTAFRAHHSTITAVRLDASQSTAALLVPPEFR